MVQISSIITALALAVTSVEAGCYGLSSAGWSATLGKDRHEERDHVRNMCRGYTDGSGFHRGALQDVCQLNQPTLFALVGLMKPLCKDLLQALR